MSTESNLSSDSVPTFCFLLIFLFLFILYSLLSASIGFRFDALTEGINPNTIPITIEKITEIAIAAPLIATGTDATSEIR